MVDFCALKAADSWKNMVFGKAYFVLENAVYNSAVDFFYCAICVAVHLLKNLMLDRQEALAILHDMYNLKISVVRVLVEYIFKQHFELLT